jgi:hypothetical protein
MVCMAMRWHAFEVRSESQVDHFVLAEHVRVEELEVFIRREDAERFIDEVPGDDPQIAAKLRIEERELEAEGRN